MVLVELEEVSVRRRLKTILHSVSLRIRAGEVWVIAGANGSGKSTLARLACGADQPWGGRVTLRAQRPALVSFERAEAELERIRREDTSSVMHGAIDPGRTPLDLVDPDSRSRLTDSTTPEHALAQGLGAHHILRRGLRFLSTGELRKALLIAEIVRDPDLLVLDDPFDGLDRGSRDELAGILRRSAREDRATLIVTGRAHDLVGHETHVIELAGGSVAYCGPISGWEPRANHVPASRGMSRNTAARGKPDIEGEVTAQPTPRAPGRELVAMRDVRLAFGDTPILRNVTWTVREGERWMLHGPNGSGKSTILSLITGENPKAYGQDIRLFGQRKGSGESVWDIKRRIGFVSGDFHMRYPGRFTVREVVLSGFRDSVGLYERPSGFEMEEADALLDRFGLAGHEERRLRDLSFGMQRLALIARAIVKQPDLLIADEPCQGLDDAHTRLVLETIDAIASDHTQGPPRSGPQKRLPALLYVTHDPDEELRCLSHEIELIPSPHGSEARTGRWRTAT